ncbi:MULTISPECIES: hypothetical protein [Rhodanobacter]|uniref:hypothetical protein n=1 Tax=Rhodanobacter TaxID=75309 RepID=UPI0011F87D51|nr:MULTISPECIES: hypothetical protein [Rhodanobacter]TAN17141.1 MAG: hypothetical protein EPN35_08010 [Rhodanobacter sp.]UJJ53731.1 hypothetical protein LRK53_12205 [Rhodanobacter thiooxydans]
MATFPGNVLLVSQRVYVLSTGAELPVRQKLGWCSQCQNTAAIENLDPSVPEQELQDIRESRLAREGELKDRLRVFFRRPRNDVKSWDQDEQILTQTIMLLALRHNDPHCLKCGSPDVIELPPFTADLSGRPVNTGFAHPGCFGRLWFSFDPDMRVAVVPKRVAYDQQGKQIGGDQPSVPA